MIKVKQRHLRMLFKSLKKLKVLVIGDTIIDKYVFALPKGRAVKDPILSTEYKGEETYGGGVLKVANHIAGFAKSVKVVTLLGDKRHEVPANTWFIQKFLLEKGVGIKPFFKKGGFTPLKKRYVSPYRYEKLFKIEYMTDEPIGLELTREINTYLKRVLKQYDLVVVADFGHGFINKSIIETIRLHSKFLCVNCQSNSSNMGYNYFTKYAENNNKINGRLDYLSLTEEEARLPMHMRWEDIETVALIIAKKYHIPNLMITLGKKGSIFINKGKIFKASAFVTKPKDTMGAGDSLYSITSLLVYKGTEPKLIPFIGNIAGGVASVNIGNKESLNPDKMMKFIRGGGCHE